MAKLKELLFKEYGGFADRRIENVEDGHLFAVDDRTADDNAPDGNLQAYFCMIFADVISPTRLNVVLSGNVPDSDAVREWAEKYEAQSGVGMNADLQLAVQKGEQPRLRELADAIRFIVAPGAPSYPVASYKYICPRTAASLERLADILDKAWGR
jgi:hypothetical protein